jgi:hypothetical protein
VVSVPQIISQRVRDAEIENGIFVGPQVRELINDEKFDDQMN